MIAFDKDVHKPNAFYIAGSDFVAKYPSTVAKLLKAGERTVREWRDSPEGQKLLADARKAREATFLDAAERARRILREGAEKAALVLVDQLSSGDAATRSIAARTIESSSTTMTVGAVASWAPALAPGYCDTRTLSRSRLARHARRQAGQTRIDDAVARMSQTKPPRKNCPAGAQAQHLPRQASSRTAETST